MVKYEVAIPIIDEDYIDSLITSLVRQGYDVYYNKDEGKKGKVCFSVYDEDEVTKIKGEE